MSTNLIILPDKSTVMLPVARNPGAEQLRADGLIERLPEWLPDERLAKRFVMAVATEVNRLDADVNPVSIVRTAFNCAVLGLLPGPQLGHAHFVPFKKECQLVIGYKGWLELAYGCGFLKDVQCEVVLVGEEFDRWNDSDGGQIFHDLSNPDRDESWGKVQAAYCIWHAMTGGHGIEVVGKKQLEKLKKKGNVWDSNPIEMSKKTPLIRSSKRWKRTGQMAAADMLSEAAERGEAQPYVGDKPIDDAADDPTPKLAQFDVPSEGAALGPETDENELSDSLFTTYNAQLQNATLLAALDMVLTEVQSDSNLSQGHRDALEATYETCKVKFKT